MKGRAAGEVVSSRLTVFYQDESSGVATGYPGTVARREPRASDGRWMLHVRFDEPDPNDPNATWEVDEAEADDEEWHWEPPPRTENRKRRGSHGGSDGRPPSDGSAHGGPGKKRSK